ncbi:MAG: hypothetical protein M3Y82_07120 [Verrucomicrobiota bacterium]|nr:hypothetical protein [Verrucomicrobiota bacterium]
MSDETKIRPGREGDAGDGDGERAGQQSPLQGRAAFIKNWDWQFVTSFNRGACERGKAQFGNNSEAHEQVRQRWEAVHTQVLTLGEALDFLFQCHRSAPFLFFNGNTFGEIARRIVDAVFVEFPLARRREAASLGAHYVAGVLDGQSLESGLIVLAELADFKPGDRVKTLRGSMSGTILRLLPDGRVVWRADSGAELTALPEALLKEKKK